MRSTYLNTQEKCYALLETLRVGRDYVPDAIYENGEFRALTQEELQARWLLLSDNVNKYSGRDYKRLNVVKPLMGAPYSKARSEWSYIPKYIGHVNQINQASPDERWERHIERILTLAEFIMYHPIERTDGTPISIKFVMSSYGYKFRLLDIVRQYKQRGVTIAKRANDVSQRIVRNIPMYEAAFDGTDDLQLAIHNYCTRYPKERRELVCKKLKEYQHVRRALNWETWQSLEAFIEKHGDVLDENGFIIENYN